MTIEQSKKLKIGDEVIYTGDSFRFGPLTGWKGKILHIEHYNNSITVEWEYFFRCGKNPNGEFTSLIMGEGKCYIHYMNEECKDFKLIKPIQLELEF